MSNLKLVRSLKRKHQKLVLAESCTGGLAAARLTEIPGVSEVFCGSHVTYRESSKRAWLGVSAKTLKRFWGVSAEVAVAMVRGALKQTPEATVAGAVTGYLGPSGKPVGLVYIAVMRRGSRSPVVTEHRLGTVAGSAGAARIQRRKKTVDKIFAALTQLLNSNP